MHVGVITTSWPSRARPWAGHFVRDQAVALAELGVEVSVIAPRWSGHGPLESSPRLRMVCPRLRGAPGSLARFSWYGASVFTRLRAAAKTVKPDLWLCHWWPTRFVVTSKAPCLVVLHGSDVDWLERLPRFARRWVGHRVDPVAVAGHVSRRFAVAAETPPPPVLPLGAMKADSQEELPPMAREWLDHPGPRLLTVGRAAPGKGWETVKQAAKLMPDLAWLELRPEHGLGPRGVRSVMARAHSVVVPSERGEGLPSEGLPHVIIQALVAGVPVVGGPAEAVQDTLGGWGQGVVRDGGPDALASAIRRALEPEQYRVMEARAREAGSQLHWNVVAPRWMELLRAARRSPAHQTRSETPSC